MKWKQFFKIKDGGEPKTQCFHKLGADRSNSKEMAAVFRNIQAAILKSTLPVESPSREMNS